MAKKPVSHLDAARAAVRAQRPVQAARDAASIRALIEEAIPIFVETERVRHALRGRPEALNYPGMTEWLGLFRLRAVVEGDDERAFIQALRGIGLADIPSQESLDLQRGLLDAATLPSDFVEHLTTERERLKAFTARLQRGDDPEQLKRLTGALRAEQALHAFEDAVDIEARDIADYAIVFLTDARWDSFSPFERMDVAPILEVMTKVPRSKRGETREEIENGVAELKQTQQFVDPRRCSALDDALAEQSVFDARAAQALDIAAAWEGNATLSSLQLFETHFRPIPRALRPFAHELKQRAPRYYGALAVQQTRLGQTLEDLFPIDPSARGAPQKPMPSVEDAAEILADRRRRDRERKAAARKRVEPS